MLNSDEKAFRSLTKEQQSELLTWIYLIALKCPAGIIMKDFKKHIKFGTSFSEKEIVAALDLCLQQKLIKQEGIRYFLYDRNLNHD